MSLLYNNGPRKFLSPSDGLGFGDGEKPGDELYTNLNTTPSHDSLIIKEENGEKQIDIPANIHEWGRDIFYRIVIAVLRGEEKYEQYAEYKNQLHKYIRSKFGWAYPREQLVDFLDIWREVEYEGLQIPIFFDAFGFIDFAYTHASFDGAEETFFCNVLKGGEEFDKYYMLKPQIAYYIQHTHLWEGNPGDYAKTIELHNDAFPYGHSEILFNQNGEFDFVRMIRKYSRKEVQKNIGDLLKSGDRAIGKSTALNTAIEKAILSTGKFGVLEYMKHHIKPLITFFDSMKSIFERNDVDSGIHGFGSVDWNILKGWFSDLNTALQVKKDPSLDDDLDILLLDKFGNSKGTLLFDLINIMDEEIQRLFSQTGPQIFANCFASFVGLRNRVSHCEEIIQLEKHEQILQTCARSFIKDYIGTLPVSPIRFRDGDEAWEAFQERLRNAIRKKNYIRYLSHTADWIEDTETGVNLPISSFMIKFRPEQIENQLGSAVSMRHKESLTTKDLASKLEIIKNKYFSHIYSLDILCKDVSYYLSYRGVTQPIRDFCETGDEEMRKENLISWIRELDEFEDAAENSGDWSNPFNKGRLRRKLPL